MSTATFVNSLITVMQTSPQGSDVVKEQPGVHIWFVVSCILLPVAWGIIVHQVFRRIRKTRRPDNTREQTDSDYQI